MAGLSIPLDENTHFDVVTHDPTTGGESNATSTTFEVFEEATDTAILTGQTLTLRSGATGNYRGTIAVTAANGFEVGKYYNVIGKGTVGGVTGKVVAQNFRVVAAETIVGIPEVDVTHIVGGLVPTPATTGIPDVNVREWLDTAVTISGALPDVNVETMDAGSIASGTIAAAELTNIENEIWDALKAAHVVANSFGDFLDIEISSRLAAADINLTAGVLDEVALVTGHIPQTGDSFTRIGAAGASLTDLGGMSTGMRAEVQVEANDALVANNLDHLLLTPIPLSFEDTVDFDSVVGHLVQDSSGTGTSGGGFTRETDSLEAIRLRGDAAWITGAGTGLTPLASGTAQGGTASTIQLAAGETFADNELNGNNVKITSGTGVGQSRIITAYTGATDTATITPDWTTNPDATSVYEVVEGSTNVVAWLNVAPNALISGAVDADVSVIQTNVITAAAMATDAINEIRDAIISDATAFQGADIATILTDTNSLNGTKITTARANNLDNLDAAISSLNNLSPADIIASLEDAGLVLETTTIATLASQTDFTLTTGPPDDEALTGHILVIEDATTSTQKTVVLVASYTGSTKRVTLHSTDIPDFVIAVGDNVGAIPVTPALPARLAGLSLGLAIAGIHVPAQAPNTAGGLPVSIAGGLDLDAKLAETNEITAARMGALTDWIDGGRLDLLLDLIKAVTDLLPDGGALNDLASILINTAEIGVAGAGLTDLGGMSTGMKSEVNVEVLDVFVTDIFTEPSSVPAATASLKDKIGWLTALSRNKGTQTNTTKTLRNDGDAADIATAAISDDGTTFIREEWL